MSSTPKLRSLGDRIRQIALFEIGGLVLITPPFAWLSGVPLSESLGMLALLALIAAVWNGCYNTGFDWVEGRLTGRTVDRRPFRLRCLHALGFETGLLILSLIHCLLEAGKIDLDYLARWTNAPLLVNATEGPEKGLILKNAESQPFVIDRRTGQPAPWDGKGVEPDLGATWQGNRTVFQLVLISQ